MNNPFEVIDARLSSIENLIRDLRQPNPVEQVETDRWFDLNELCAYLPDKPRKATVYGWVHESVIPCHKGAKKLRFLKSEIDTWLMQGKKRTFQEVHAETKRTFSK